MNVTHDDSEKLLNNSSSLIIPGSDALIYSKPVAASIYIVFTLIALAFGTIGNIMLLFTMFRHRKLQKIGRTFIINQAVADLCVASVAEPLCLIAVFLGDSYYSKRIFMCEFISGLCLSACYCAFLSLGLLSFSRMFYICHNEYYKALFGGWKKYAYCAICWIIGFLFELSNFFGFNGLHYDMTQDTCMWHRTINDNRPYTIAVSVMLIAVPLFLILAANFKIFLKIHNTKKRLHTYDNATKSTVWTETIKASKTLFIICGAFCICWLPYCITNLVDGIVPGMIDGMVHLFITMIAHAHSALNFTIYVTTNRPFRDAFFNTFGFIFSTSRSYSTSSGTGKTSSTPVAKYSNSSQSKDRSCTDAQSSVTLQMKE